MNQGLILIAPQVVESLVTFTLNPQFPHLQWQGPACTEGLVAIKYLKNQVKNDAVSFAGSDLLFSYPWATVIDRRCIENAINDFASWTADDINVQAGIENRRIHTVCQSIHWHRILPYAKAIGITDLHISHFTSTSWQLAVVFGIIVHSFPLIAACYFDTASLSIVIPEVKPPSRRKWLMGFNGNHMPHYRSNIRLLLQQQFEESRPQASYFELKDKWFYNDFVYEFQVQSKIVPEETQCTISSGVAKFRAQLEDTVFSLCPEGAGPNTLRFWESLSAGAVPVIFEGDWIPPKCEININDIALIVPNSQIKSAIEYILSYWESNKCSLDLWHARYYPHALRYAELEVRKQTSGAFSRRGEHKTSSRFNGES